MCGGGDAGGDEAVLPEGGDDPTAESLFDPIEVEPTEESHLDPTEEFEVDLRRGGGAGPFIREAAAAAAAGMWREAVITQLSESELFSVCGSEELR